jgi:hypothetical protein
MKGDFFPYTIIWSMNNNIFFLSFQYLHCLFHLTHYAGKTSSTVLNRNGHGFFVWFLSSERKLSVFQN